MRSQSTVPGEPSAQVIDFAERRRIAALLVAGSDPVIMALAELIADASVSGSERAAGALIAFVEASSLGRVTRLIEVLHPHPSVVAACRSARTRAAKSA